MGAITTRAASLAAALAAAALAAAGCGGSDGPSAAPARESGVTTEALASASDRGAPVLGAPIELIDGGALTPARLRGRVVLVVNTASRCGYTPQFEGLEALSASRGADGLTVVGFPSDDFDQELEDPGDIAAFCALNYGVRFPMAAPGAVTGPSAHPLFAAIAARPGAAGEPPGWNFTKYLLDRRGRLVARYEPGVEPDDPRLGAAVDRLLEEPAEF